MLCPTGQAQVGNGFEHANLIGRTGAAAGEHQGSQGARFWWNLRGCKRVVRHEAIIDTARRANSPQT
jgi:hypothetical protein